MSKLLIRAGKDPFTSVLPETTLTQDVFNSNTGNFLFQHSVWEALAVDGNELVANSTLSERRATPAADIAAINEQFDRFVIPFANAFRPDFLRQLERLTEVIEQLSIPVSVIGVGAQAPASMSLDDLAPARKVTKRFAKAVLERSPSIGVRGEFTRKFLLDLGFDDDQVDIIGCPSLFRRGPKFHVDKQAETLPADARMALNLTPEVPGIGQFSLEQAAAHPNLTYIGQDGHDLRLMLWGKPHPHVSDLNAPVHMSHPLYRENRMRMFVDQWTWFSFLATQDFAYGTRFHGNVAALMAGTPAMLLAHDSRTVELAEYHQMPHVVISKFDAPVSTEALYEKTDLSGFNSGMAEGFDRYVAFLERHDLTHKWQDGASTDRFDEQLEAATFPPAVKPVTDSSLDEVVARMNWIRHGMVLDMTRHPERYEYPFEHPRYSGSGSRFARLQRQYEVKDAKQADQIAELTRRVRQLERGSLVHLVKRAFAKIGNLFKG